MPHTLDNRGILVSLEGETMTTKEQMLAIRRSTGLSQAAFGKRFGIPTRTVENWESGVNACPTYVAEMLAVLAKTDYHTPRLDEEERSPH